MKKRVLTVMGAALLAAGMTMTACAEEPITIGFANYAENFDFFITVKESMEAAVEAKGDELLYATTDQDAEKMRSNWDTFVLQGADIIVDASIMGDAGGALASQYKKAGNIPVVSVDNVYTDAYFFGVNNQLAGEVAGEFAAKKITEKWDGQVDAMCQFYASTNGEEVQRRNSGIFDGMVANGIEITEDQVTWVDAVNTSGGLDPADMKAKVTDYLTAHSDDHHILIACFNDDGGSSALAAVKGAGREDDVMIVSHNADPVSLDNLALEGENCWVGTVSYSPETYGDQIVELCHRIVAGEEVDEATYANVFIISDENIDEYR